MSSSPNHIGFLYQNHPRLYNLVANDRDFGSEIDCIIDLLEYSPRLALETFAGQALHAQQLENRGITSYALDRSNEMKSEAFNSENYLLGELPDAISIFLKQFEFDLILAMRFGIGHLNHDELRRFLCMAKSVLSDHGTIVLEVHRNIAPDHQFSDLEILARKTISEEYGDITCYWPYGKIDWTGNKATMPVKISYTIPKYTELLFTAPEYIHDRNDIDNIFESLGMRTEIFNFSSYSNLLVAKFINSAINGDTESHDDVCN